MLPAFAFSLFIYLLFLVLACYLQRDRTATTPAITLLLANAGLQVGGAFHILADVYIWGISAAVAWLPVVGLITTAAMVLTQHQRRENYLFAKALLWVG